MLIIDQSGTGYYFWKQKDVPRLIFNLSLEIFSNILPSNKEDAFEIRCNIPESDSQITLGVFESLDTAIKVLRELNNATYSDDKFIYYIPKED